MPPPLHPPPRPPRTFETTLSFVRTNHDAHPIAHVKAPHRSKSLRCSSETENGIREGIIMNYAPYLAVIRGEHVRAAASRARSIGPALIDKPVLEAVRCSREGNSEQWPMQPPTGGSLSWRLLPLGSGHGGGHLRFAAVMAQVVAHFVAVVTAEVFLHQHKNNAKKSLHMKPPPFFRRNLLWVCAYSRHLRRQAHFSTRIEEK